jgi:hypothetical protein
MKRSELREIIRETLVDAIELESSAGEEAKRKGLVSKGWGRYADPRTGQITHQSKDGKLVPVVQAVSNEPSYLSVNSRKRQMSLDDENKLIQLASRFGGELTDATSSGVRFEFDSVQKRNAFRNKVKMLFSKHDTQEITEDTTLRSLVAKAQSEQLANNAVSHLKKHGIQARAADGAKFGLTSDEPPGWGVYVEPGSVKKAGKTLTSVSRGLEFDPYTRTPGKEK